MWSPRTFKKPYWSDKLVTWRRNCHRNIPGTRSPRKIYPTAKWRPFNTSYFDIWYIQKICVQNRTYLEWNTKKKFESSQTYIERYNIVLIYLLIQCVQYRWETIFKYILSKVPNTFLEIENGISSYYSQMLTKCI